MTLPYPNDHSWPLKGDILTVKPVLPTVVYPHFISVVKDAHDLLVPGKQYTVSKCEVYSSWCAVWLEEFPDKDRHFHLAFFEWDYSPKKNPNPIMIENGVFSEDEDDRRKSAKIASEYYDNVVEIDSILAIDKLPYTKFDFYRGSFATRSILRGNDMLTEHESLSFFDCDNWVPALNDYYINNDYKIDTMENCLGLTFPMFIRPCKGDKQFSGQLFTNAEHFKTEYTFTTVNRNIERDIRCLYASPKIIVEEYRCVFVNHRLVSTCGYLMNGERADFVCPGSAIDLAIIIADRPYFKSKVHSFVIDICKDDAGYVYLLEINSIHNASFYSCDLHAIYKKLSKQAYCLW